MNNSQDVSSCCGANIIIDTRANHGELPDFFQVCSKCDKICDSKVDRTASWQKIFDQNNHFERMGNGKHPISNEFCHAWDEGLDCCLEKPWIKEFIRGVEKNAIQKCALIMEEMRKDWDERGYPIEGSQTIMRELLKEIRKKILND